MNAQALALLQREAARRRRLRDAILERWEVTRRHRDRVRLTEVVSHVAAALGRVEADGFFKAEVTTALRGMGVGKIRPHNIRWYTGLRERVPEQP